MSDHEVLRLIKQADYAISTESFDRLLDFYAADAALVVRPGQIAHGKRQIKEAFKAIAKHFNNSLTVTQGDAHVIEGGGNALVNMETLLSVRGIQKPIRRRATYVFKQSDSGEWLCTVDNSYGTDLLDALASG